MKRRHLNLAVLSVTIILLTGFFFTTSVAHEPLKTPPCMAIEDEVRQQCAQMQENQWYDGGAVNYQRQDHLKDIPRCNNFATNIFHFCNKPGE